MISGHGGYRARVIAFYMHHKYNETKKWISIQDIYEAIPDTKLRIIASMCHVECAKKAGKGPDAAWKLTRTPYKNLNLLGYDEEFKVIKKISEIVREEMDKVGGQEVFMSALNPKANWEQTDRWDNFDALFKLQSQHGSEYALGPTHEEIIVPISKKFISSYKDLVKFDLKEGFWPKAVYQIQTKFRDEPRAKSGLLRGREFYDLAPAHPVDSPV